MINKKSYAPFIRDLMLILLVVVVIRSFAFELYKVPSGSMFDTLYIGDKMLVTKYDYGYSGYSFWLPASLQIAIQAVLFGHNRILAETPQRGDIIVFKPPNDLYTYYVKRLIALPGDTIRVYRSIVYINGIPLNYEDTSTIKIQSNMYANRKYESFPMDLSKAPRKHTIVDMNINFHVDHPDTTDEFKVPESHYFFMGDNRNNSIDSRFRSVGFVPAENIVGKVKLLIYNDAIFGGDFSRLFKHIT